jgi:bifunctional enzyme CysN/CysC
VGYSQEVFESIRRDFADFAAKLEVADLTFIPVSALRGDNVTVPSPALAWHKGGSLLNHLETVHIASDRNLIDLRFPVQCALRTSPTSRAYLGTVASGSVKPGDEVTILPSGVCTTVKSVLGPDGEIPEAFPPLAAGITLAEEIDVSRGDMIVHKHNVPRVDRELEAMLVWMAPAPMRPGQTYRIKHATRLITGTVAELRYRVDVNTLHRAAAEELGLNEIGRCAMMFSVPVAYDPYVRNRTTGAFIVIDPITNNTVGAGMVLDRQRCPAVLSDTRLDAPPRSEHVHAHTSPVTVEQRAHRLGQHPACVWLTGLTGSGKTTLAYALERRLFDQGFHCVVLDGENVRLGFSHDLAFSADDRAENIRRTAEVARLFNDAGIIAICSLLSPYAKARDLARRTVGQERFLDVYLSAPVDICRQRDTRGLYALADRGEIPNFSGVSAPYEPPTSPDLVLPTHELAVAPCVDRLEDLLRKRGFLGTGR